MPVVVGPQPRLVAQAIGQAGMPRQHVTLQLRFPRNAREIAGQPGALVQPCLDGRDRIVGADQIVARDQHMGAALGRVVAGCGMVQLCKCASGFTGLRDIGQQRPRHRVAIQVLTDANRMQLEGPFAMLDGSVAIGGRQHLYYRHAGGGEMGDEVVFFFQAGRTAHAVVVALDEQRAVHAVDDGGRQRSGAMPARLAVLAQLPVTLAQPRDVRRADRWPVGSDLVVVEAPARGGKKDSCRSPGGESHIQGCAFNAMHAANANGRVIDPPVRASAAVMPPRCLPAAMAATVVVVAVVVVALAASDDHHRGRSSRCGSSHGRNDDRAVVVTAIVVVTTVAAVGGGQVADRAAPRRRPRWRQDHRWRAGCRPRHRPRRRPGCACPSSTSRWHR